MLLMGKYTKPILRKKVTYKDMTHRVYLPWEKTLEMQQQDRVKRKKMAPQAVSKTHKTN